MLGVQAQFISSFGKQALPSQTNWLCERNGDRTLREAACATHGHYREMNHDDYPGAQIAI